MNDRDATGGRQAVAPGPQDPPILPDAPWSLAAPNVSEGRDPGVIAALCDAITATGTRVLDVHSDPDHHRSVITIAGPTLSVLDGLVALAGECLELIDLRRQRGIHPRIGALDVAPIVARNPGDLELARDAAAALADRIGAELGLPVFRYGAVAAHPERVRPRDFRGGGVDWLAEKIEGGEIVPDAGPPRLHPSAGGVLVGARPPLIAWNVELAEGGLAEARAIAARVRESGGGLPGVMALGLWLASRERAQVSMNIENHLRTPPAHVVATVRAEAERLGARAGASELVGMVPGEALAGVAPSALGLAGFRPGLVLDAALRGAGRP